MDHDLITPYGLRQHAAALTLPTAQTVRRIFYAAAKEIEELAAERDHLNREIQECYIAIYRLAQIAAEEVTP